MKHTFETSETLETYACNMLLKIIATCATFPDLLVQHPYKIIATYSLCSKL
jgi:hypothetical protein